MWSSKKWWSDAQRAEYSNITKKTQEEMKITLAEIKKNLWGTYSGGDEAGIQVNDLEHKEEISI